MRTMLNLVSDVISLDRRDLDLFAEALALYSSDDTSTILENCLHAHNRTQFEKTAGRCSKIEEISWFTAFDQSSGEYHQQELEIQEQNER